MEISKEVLDAIIEELDYQDRKWGESQSQSLAGYLIILEAELNEAKEGKWRRVDTGVYISP